MTTYRDAATPRQPENDNELAHAIARALHAVGASYLGKLSLQLGENYTIRTRRGIEFTMIRGRLEHEDGYTPFTVTVKLHSKLTMSEPEAL